MISPTLRIMLCNKRGMKAHYSGYKVPRHTHCRMKCVGAMCQLGMRIGRSDTCGRVAILLPLLTENSALRLTQPFCTVANLSLCSSVSDYSSLCHFDL